MAFSMPTLLKHIMTSSLNQDKYEISRTLTVILFFAFLCYSLFDIIHNTRFDPVSFSFGGTGIIAGGAGASRIKRDGMNQPLEKNNQFGGEGA